MHDVGVMIAGEDVAGAAHVRGQLIDFVKAAVHRRAAIDRIAQVGGNEIVGFGRRKIREFQVNGADPETFAFQPLDQVRTDKPTATANQRRLHLLALVVFSTAADQADAGGIALCPTIEFAGEKAINSITDTAV